MKLLDISAITNAAQMPVKKGTLKFLQDSYTEITATTLKALIGASYSPTVMYVLSGSTNSATAPTYAIIAGSVFFNGEIFNVIPSSFTVGAGNVAVFSLVQTQYTTDADPVTFTDNTARNIHNIRQVQVSQGASGSGLMDYSQAFFLSFAIPPQLSLTGAGSAVVSGTYPTLTVTVPITGLTNPILGAGTYNVGNVPATSTDYPIVFAAISTANYYIMGTIISNGVRANDTNCIWTISNRTTTGFTLTVNEVAATVQNIAFEYILFAK